MIHRPFNRSFIVDDNFIKYSTNDRLADEIYYYNMLQKHNQKDLFAEFRGDVSDGIYFALKLKKYDFNNFYENYKNLNFDTVQAFQKILENLRLLHSAKPQKILKNSQCCKVNEFILITKTVDEFSKFINQNNSFIEKIRHYEFLNINGNKCLQFDKIWPEIEKLINSNYCNAELSLIHGDFCFANILHNHLNDQIVMIDPRGFYHMRGCYGDKCYDYAKLLHSLHGNYEQIIYNDYLLSISNNNIYINFKFNFVYFIEILKSQIVNDFYYKAKLIEGLLFISMCSRHYSNEEHQLIMYCQGLLILNEIYNDSIQLLKSSNF